MQCLRNVLPGPGPGRLGLGFPVTATMQESWVSLEARHRTGSGSRGIQEEEQI